MDKGFMNCKSECPYCDRTMYLTGKEQKLYISDTMEKTPHGEFEIRVNNVTSKQ